MNRTLRGGSKLLPYKSVCQKFAMKSSNKSENLKFTKEDPQQIEWGRGRALSFVGTQILWMPPQA